MNKSLNPSFLEISKTVSNRVLDFSENCNILDITNSINFIYAKLFNNSSRLKATFKHPYFFNNF